MNSFTGSLDPNETVAALLIIPLLALRPSWPPWALSWSDTGVSVRPA